MTRLADPNIANSWQRYRCQLPAVTEPYIPACIHLNKLRDWGRSELCGINESTNKESRTEIKPRSQPIIINEMLNVKLIIVS